MELVGLDWARLSGYGKPRDHLPSAKKKQVLHRRQAEEKKKRTKTKQNERTSFFFFHHATLPPHRWQNASISTGCGPIRHSITQNLHACRELRMCRPRISDQCSQDDTASSFLLFRPLQDDMGVYAASLNIMLVVRVSLFLAWQNTRSDKPVVCGMGSLVFRNSASLLVTSHYLEYCKDYFMLSSTVVKSLGKRSSDSGRQSQAQAESMFLAERGRRHTKLETNLREAI